MRGISPCLNRFLIDHKYLYVSDQQIQTMSTLLIRNGTIISPNSIIQDSNLLVRDGVIESISADLDMDADEIIEANGKFILPGIIDLHTDALESEITPRPGANFPLRVALQEIDTKMLSCGITTVYHSIHLGYDDAVRSSKSKYTRSQIIEATREFGQQSALCDSRIHLRFEITGVHALETLKELLEEQAIDLLSFMDHTPGQGQYPRDVFIKNRLSEGYTEDQAIKELEKRQSRDRVSRADLEALTHRAIELGIPVASHDDDQPEVVRQNAAMGLGISEFPINMETAEAATELGMHVLGGASNVLRGGSLSGNLSMTEAIKAGVLDGLCSDYYPPAIYHSIFRLHYDHGIALPESVRLATLNPATAAGIQHSKGSIEEGKSADIILVEQINNLPRVTHTLVNGQLVFRSPKGKNHTPSEKVSRGTIPESKPNYTNA